MGWRQAAVCRRKSALTHTCRHTRRHACAHTHTLESKGSSCVRVEWTENKDIWGWSCRLRATPHQARTSGRGCRRETWEQPSGSRSSRPVSRKLTAGGPAGDWRTPASISPRPAPKRPPETASSLGADWQEVALQLDCSRPPSGLSTCGHPPSGPLPVPAHSEARPVHVDGLEQPLPSPRSVVPGVSVPDTPGAQHVLSCVARVRPPPGQAP